MAKPLNGVRILDLTHMLSGPYGAMILADLGAETIKVEPLKGEGTRKLLASDPNNSLNGQGAYFITLNRNKQSVAVDLKSEAGLAVFYDLVRSADVVIENFSAGVARKLKIDYEHLSAINPRIITCAISGFGSNGPNFQRPAFDQVVQALGGGMSITGTDAAHPTRAGIPIGDLGGGMFGVMGVLSALYEREQSGRGQHVDISMLDCQISMLNYMATMYFLSGEVPHPIGNSHFVHVPYNSYPTADGHIIIAVIFDSFWDNLLDVVDEPAFRDEKYLTQPGRLADKAFIDGRLAEILSTETSDTGWSAWRRSAFPAHA
jgi:CoA:oxalate CoA-transferase